MTKPVYQILTYTGAVLDHTITADVPVLTWTETLTDAVGSFSFTVPARKGSDYVFDDIALHDKVKIYADYDTIPATPNFVGYVTKIVGLSNNTREISGLSQGEILLRRQIANTSWTSTAASSIVTDIATDLSLGAGDITAEADQEDIEVETETYFDLLRRVSDYWVDGANQVKYDFYVDVDNDLFWDARPIRTVGVETLTVGENIKYYNVTRDVNPVKNNITVYGAAQKTNPSASDAWTEAIAGWASDGTLSVTTDNQVGTNSVKTNKAATTSVYLSRDITQFSCRWPKEFRTVNFWWKVTDDTTRPGYWVLYLYAPDAANYFLYGVELPPIDEWYHFSAPIGPNTPYGYYRGTVGSPSWEQIDYVYFYMAAPTNRVLEFYVDAFHFGGARFSGNVNNAASQASYGQRDLEIIDDALVTDTMCSQRAETLLYRLKDPPTYISVTTDFNSNLLAGDQLSMTIPAEGISAASYDVYEVTHLISEAQGGLSKALMVDSQNYRVTPLSNNSDAIVKLHMGLKTLNRGVQTIA